MMNLSVAGKVGKDAEVRQAGSSEVCNFSLAVSGYDRKAKAKTTTWIKIAIWGRRASQLASLITKGSRVACSGELEVGEYQGKPQLTVTCQDVTLLGSGGPGGQQQSRTGGARKADKADDSFDDLAEDDGSDIPF